MPDSLADILARLTVLTDTQAAAPPAPMTPLRPVLRAINCKTFCIGQQWGTFKDYFRENVRAAHRLTHGDEDADKLDKACCNFIGSKLEPGATMTAYQSLSDDIKDDWEDLEAELAKLFVNEEQKRIFLSNVGSFKRGDQTLIAYRNELERRVNSYQPDLKNVAIEYQRQLVQRFIEGIDDVKLKKKLHCHCKREKTHIDKAFQFAVDYEASEFEEKGKELAANGGANLAAAAALTSPTAASSSLAYYDIDPEIEANRRDIEELQVEQVLLDDKITQLQSDMRAGFKRIESLIVAKANAESNADSLSNSTDSAAATSAYAATTWPRR